MTFDWNDLRFFLAVIDHGSTKRAAKALGVDQTTCARRIGALEASLGLELFNRDSGRYRPTRDALELVESAKAVDATASAFRDQAASRGRVHGRKIRVTGEEMLTPNVIVPAVARFSRLHPDAHVDIDVSRDLRDLLAGEADIALRGGFEPNEPGLVRRKLADDPFGLYCSADYPSPPRCRTELSDHPIACHEAMLERLESAGLASQITHVVNSGAALRAIIAEGDAVGWIPRSLAEAPPPLRLCFASDVPTAIWVVYPERLRRFPKIRDLARLLAEEFHRWRRSGT